MPDIIKQDSLGKISFQYNRVDEEDIIKAFNKAISKMIKNKKVKSAIEFKFEGFPNTLNSCFRMAQLPQDKYSK